MARFSRSRFRHAGIDERQADIAQDGRAGQQIEGLEDEADRFAADIGQLVVGELRDVLAVQEIFAGCRRVEGAEDCMSVDLPEPDGPMIATNSPSSMVKLTPRKAGVAMSPVNMFW